MEDKKPRTGGKAGDRKDKHPRKDHDKGGKSDKFGNRNNVSRPNQPKYDDTEEAKKQKNLIRTIEQEINTIQDNLKRQDRVKVVKRGHTNQQHVHHTLKDKAAVENQIQSLQKKVTEKEEELKKLQPEVKRLQDIANEKKTLVNKLRGGVFFNKVADPNYMKTNEKKLQEEIQRLEKRLETETLSISEEKVVVKEIKSVKAMKANFAPYQKRALEAKTAQDNLMKQIKETTIKENYIKQWKEDVALYQADLIALSEKEQEAKKKVEEEKKKVEVTEKKELSEKDKLIKKVDDLVIKLRQEKENLRLNRDNWYEGKRQARNKKNEEMNQERAEKRKEQEQEEKEELAKTRLDRKLQIPLDYEMGTCQSLITYLTELQKATAKTEEKKEDEKKEEVKKTEEPKKEGEQGYIKGRDAHEDLLFPDKNSQAKKAKKNKKKKAAKITHNWDTFTRFEELGLGDPPIAAAQIPKAIEQVRAKLEQFKKESAVKKAEILKDIAKEEEEEKKVLAEKKKREAEEKKAEEANKPKEEEKKAEEPKKEEAKKEEPKKEEKKVEKKEEKKDNKKDAKKSDNKKSDKK